MCLSQIKIDKAQSSQYKENLQNINKDLKSNKLMLKLVQFGANEDSLSIAKGICPTCSQPVDDILLSHDNNFKPMTIQDNITHLENQSKMIDVLITCLEKDIENNKEKLVFIKQDIVRLRNELISLNQDIKSTNDIKEIIVRKKIDIEDRVKNINYAEQLLEEKTSILSQISIEYKSVDETIRSLSKCSFSSEDLEKIKEFTICFKKLASNFGYRSAEIKEIEIKPDTLLPYLEDIALREVDQTSKKVRAANLSANVKSDSSASDFVRLIWSYLLSLYSTSLKEGGNHPGFILFDEPAQHSMSTKSVNKLMKVLIQFSDLQSIVAASFDESDENYAESMIDIETGKFKLERLPRKIIQKLN